MRAMPARKQLSFEESLEKLESIVQTMESGDTTLKDLMANYSEGVKLSERCLKDLTRAEQAMDLLVKEKNGKAETEPLTIEGE